ncbi:MAG: chlorite dismutase family protein [Acidobacteriota bacterium]
MDILNFQKEQNESGLRLVPGAAGDIELPAVEQQFVNFTFFRLDPTWRRLDAESKAEFKKEFISVYDRFGDELLLFSYSLIGFDSKADLMFWRIGSSLDIIQDMTGQLYRTQLGSFLEPADNYLSVTKRRMFVGYESDDRQRVTAGSKKYHFVYPCTKQVEWMRHSADERDAMIEENFMVGMKFPNIKIHLTHTFGFSEQDYLITFETDEPKAFLALAEELRETTAARLTVRGMPVYTCRQRPLIECLDSLG